ncbi:MAG: lactonase family protein [Oscillospiraceae bacterium]|nr:lactonase family protein [Oscillospiraceae bacterium]
MSDKYYAYIGTYSRGGSEGIYRVGIGDNGEARIAGAHPARDASYLARDGKRLAAAFESGSDKGGSAVALYDVLGDGSLVKRGEQPGGGSATCYVSLDGANVYSANYGSGEVGIYPLLEDGGLGGGQWIAHYGKGVNKLRQEASHAHCALTVGPDDEGKSYLAVCDLGTDIVWFYPREDGRVTLPGYAVRTPPGTGPRHAAAVDGLTWAVIGEMSCEVLVYNGYAGKARLVQRIPFARTMGDARNTASALRVSPDGSALLGAVRGEQTLGIAWRVGGEFGPAAIVDVKGKWPRDAQFTPDGRFVVAACEHSDELVVFQVTGDGLEYVSRLGVPSPTCVCFARA